MNILNEFNFINDEKKFYFFLILIVIEFILEVVDVYCFIKFYCFNLKYVFE